MRISVAFVSFVALLLTACGGDISPGSKFAGQSCYVDDDCRDGLICIGRICTPQGGGGGGIIPDGGTADDSGASDAGSPDMTIPPDLGGSCDVGDRRCLDGNRRAECVETDDGSVWMEFSCPAESTCSEGRCIVDVMCTDRDGDGYGEGCPAGPDCDDRVASINPGAEESCATPFDDDCDMEINEGCPDGGCCPEGCDDGTFCSSQCVCEAFNPNTCEFQNQPCAQEGIFSNNLYCAPIGEELRCVGICDQTADDPDSTCPEPNAICAFGEGQQGICLSGCDPALGCGEPGLGCLPISAGSLGGMCVPSNDDNQAGDTCDQDAFFDCGEGLLCTDLDGNGSGRCEQACRAFGTATTDCQGNNYCLPLSAEIGLCFPDNGQTEGDRCRPENTTCGDDAVGCYPTGMGTTRCQRLCRIVQGAGDCEMGACRQFSPDQNQLGVCR